MIVLDDTIRAIWFQPTGKDQDFLAALAEQDGKRVLTYRFRYYKDNSGDPWADDDKHWYKMTTEKPAEHVIGMVRLMLNVAPAGTDKRFELLRGDKPLDEFVREFEAQPFVSAKEVKTE